MPAIRNSELLRRFNKFFKLKTHDFLDSEAGRMLVPVVSVPVPANVIQIEDIILNDSDKTITVPSGKQWKLLYGIVVLVTTATVGNRTISFRLQDASGNVVFRMDTAATQAASLTESYIFGSFGDIFESSAGIHFFPLPDQTILPEGFSIRILDASNVDAAADDMTIRFMIEETEVTGE